MTRVLIAGLPGTGKGILSSILGTSPNLDVTFASWPNKGDHNPGDYDAVVLTDRPAQQQLQSHRRKTGMAMTDTEARQARAEGQRQLVDALNGYYPLHIWDYRRTVEQPVHETITWFAQRLDVAPWDYTGPDILDGDTTDENGMYPVVQTFRHNG